MSLRCPACSEELTAGLPKCPSCDLHLHTSPTVSETADPEDITTRAPRKGFDFPPGHIFAGRFTIIEKAGAGGMGVVYKAIDNMLAQVVALKLIHPDRAESPSYIARFKREVRLTRQITNANVCRVHDLGESDGVLFLSMEWVDGETLRQLLRKTPVLREERALQIAEKIAQALEAAHLHGIVHRDLKPENVMIDEQGEIHVVDFGLAVEQGGDNISGAMVLVGTPRYMSPEQRRRLQVDQRTDLYALGLVLQEMLTGTPPGALGQARREPDEGISRSVVPVLESLLAEARDQRCSTAREAAEMLRQIQGLPPQVPPLARRNGPMSWAFLGVLLIMGLFAYAWLKPQGLISAGQTFYLRGLELREVAENERTIDDAIHMFRRALDADPNFSRAWAAMGEAYWKRYAWNRQASSREEALIAVEKSFQLDPDLPEGHYAKAAGLFAERDFRSARTELEIAVRTQPDLDAAWALLGRVDGILGDYQEGRAALDKALHLRPRSFRHYLALGLFFDRSGEYDEAASAYRMATDLKPDSTMAWNSLGTAYLRIHNYQEAVPAFERSIKIEERGNNLSNLGTAYYFLKNFEEAARNHRAATRREPDNWGHWGNLGDSLKMLGKREEAREVYLRATGLARERASQYPQDADAHSAIGLYCARAREDGCNALGEGEKAEQLRPGDSEITFRNAIIRCLLGKDQDALDWLEKGVKLGLSSAEIENDPDLPALSRYPRYKRILELAS